MSNKSRKSLSTLNTCEKCATVMLERDARKHVDDCPSSLNDFEQTLEVWSYPFCFRDIFYSSISRVDQLELPNDDLMINCNTMVYLSKSVMDICRIEIGSPCLVVTSNVTSVKLVYPIENQDLMSVCLSNQAEDKEHLYGFVKIRSVTSWLPMSHVIHPAHEMVLMPVGNHSMLDDDSVLQHSIKCNNELKIFLIGNLTYVQHKGKSLIYEIVDIDSRKNEIRKKIETNDYCVDILNPWEIFKNLSKHLHNISCPVSTELCFKATYSTNYKILNPDKDKIAKSMYSVHDIGGYDHLISDIRRVIKDSIDKCKTSGNFNINKGILLHGHSGVGKSMIANAILSEFQKTVTVCLGAGTVTGSSVYSFDIYNKSVSETVAIIKQLFDKATLYSPSIILLEDIENLYPNRISSDHERRVLSQLLTFFDNMQLNPNNVVLIATTSKLDSVNNSLRRPGRFGIEFEICVPTPRERKEILEKLLQKIPNTLTTENIEEISSVTHGFVGADLHGLCSKAIFSAAQFQPNSAKRIVSMDHFNEALQITKPSAMNTVLVENPNVKWSDIGGQEYLKEVLEQVLKWPYEHHEDIKRLGLNAPKGVLLFGPPGCSKTMVAKAIATESSINFLSIRGPELFSKWVGESEKAVREIFRKARQVRPSIIFIDEIDALGGERAASSTAGGSNVQERVLAQLLTELDGITRRDGVTLLAATNRPDKIDKALLRPGRLDRIIYVKLPCENTRKAIFKLKFQTMKVEKDINIKQLVHLTDGYTCAEVEAICNEAGMLALKENFDIDAVKTRHFYLALKTVPHRTPKSLLQLYDNYLEENSSHSVDYVRPTFCVVVLMCFLWLCLNMFFKDFIFFDLFKHLL